ncbi:hypothetical protein [Solicola sp. PLA-1-18]|uniref:hypothetical protein n=1 Tax=Solicola sp. PLA-1-18 TaxID=3380532 RepID=UPI003B797FF5
MRTNATTRRTVAALPAALLVALAAGCGGGSSTPTGGGGASVSDPVDVETSRTEVRGAATDLLAALTAADGPLGSRGGTVRFSNGAFAPCTDDAAGFAYDTNARVDLDADSLSALPDVRAALEADGWTIDDDPGGADPATSVTARKGELTSRVLASEKPLALVKVLGPCLPVTQEQKDDFESSPGAEPLDG